MVPFDNEAQPRGHGPGDLMSVATIAAPELHLHADLQRLNLSEIAGLELRVCHGCGAIMDRTRMGETEHGFNCEEKNACMEAAGA